MQLQQLVNYAKQQCKQAKLTNSQASIYILIEHVFNKTKLDYLLKPTIELDNNKLQQFYNLLNQLIKGKPIYRIIGEREFYGLKLKLNNYTLEPRSDTEIIVETSIKYINKLFAQHNKISFLDIGVGSGAITLALLQHFIDYNLTATAVDIVPNCLQATKENALRYNLANKLTLIQSDCFTNVTSKFNLIISNPPYIASNIIKTLAKNVRNFDPIVALDGGEDGLKFYKILTQQGHNYLNNHGFIIIEIGFDQKQTVTKLFLEHNYQLIEERQDYGGNDRCLVFKRIFD